MVDANSVDTSTILSKDDLHIIMPALKRNKLDLYYPFLINAMNFFSINNKERIAAFLAQVAHESVEFTFLEEIASGAAYEGRKDLGNVHSGDGKKYKGRGIIQVTGRFNYIACGSALGLPLERQPELLELPENAFLSGAWFWAHHGCNELADINKDEQFKAITRIINGGYNGLEERFNYWYAASKVLGC